MTTFNRPLAVAARALVALVSITTGIAHAQSPIEDGSNTNTWVFGADGAPPITYRIGTDFSQTAAGSGLGITVSPQSGPSVLLPGTTAASEVLVNRLAGSVPRPLLAPPMSVVSLATALASTTRPSAPILTISPPSGSYTTTVQVTVLAVVGPTGVDTDGPIFVARNGGPELTVDGSSFTTYLVADGVTTITARAVDGLVETTATATYTLTGGSAKARDSDGDGIPDGIEVALGTDPLRDGTHDDSDGDGWSDFDEILRGTDPHDAAALPEDSDDDGWSDWDEDLRGTDPLVASSKPVAASLDAVEYLVDGATYSDAAHTTPHPGAGLVVVSDATWQLLGWLAGDPYTTSVPGFTTTDDLWFRLRDEYRLMPLATFGTARVPGDGDVVVTARVDGIGQEVLKAWVTGSAAATPALIGAFVHDVSGDSASWLAAYEAELAAYVVQPVAVDLDPASGLATAACEAAVAWAAGVDVGEAVLLGEPDGARVPEAVARVAHAFAELNDFIVLGGYAGAVAKADLLTELLAPPEPGQTTTAAVAERTQRGPPERFLSVIRYHARLITFVGWQAVLDFAPYDDLAESDPWVASGDADKDGISNEGELALGPDAATNPLYPDSDDDGTGDLSDPCPRDPSDGCNADLFAASDVDGDGVLDALDNCFGVPNRSQTDSNGDLIGDACEAPARIARPVANVAVLAPGEVLFTTLRSAAANGAITHRWTVDAANVATTPSFVMTIRADAQPQDLVVRLFAADADTTMAEVDRRLVRVVLPHGPVPCLAMTCNDGDPCTDDACDLDTGCYSTSISGCVACGSSLDCDDGNTCTSDACTGDVCVVTKLSATSCDDGQVCTSGDMCLAGTCRPGGPLDCRDTDPCTVESCVAGSGCLVEPDPTPDPLLCAECFVDGDCAAGACVGGQCCEATAFADGVARVWNVGNPAPVLCMVAGTELDIAATSSASVSFKLRDPAGGQVLASSTSTKPRSELESLASSGPHTLTFTATQTVTYTVTESEDVVAEMTTFGAPTVLSLTTLGAEAELTFEGELGQIVSILGAYADGCANNYTLFSPTGAVAKSQGTCGNSSFFEPFALTATGTWTFRVDPTAADVGDATVTVWEVPPELVIAAASDGVTRAVTFTVPGQTVAWAFAASAGDRISITSNGSGCGQYYLDAPSGSRVYTGNTCGNEFTDVVVLAEAGSYRWIHDPGSTTIPTESVTIYRLPDDPIETGIVGGAATALDFGFPGTNASLEFAATAGDVVSITFVRTNGFDCASYYLYAPSGAQAAFDNTCGTPYFDRRTLTATGTYEVFVNGGSATVGTVTVGLYAVPPDVTATLVVGAAGVAMTVTTPGQNLAPTFVGSAGASLKIVSKPVGANGITYTVLSPSGTTVFTIGNRPGNYTSPAFTLPADGTYTLLVDPVNHTVPTVTLSVTP